MELDDKNPTHNRSHNIHHFQQRYSWDCGVACVFMLLSSKQREEALGKFPQLCQEEGFGQSTWTIDLCYLLKRFNIKHCMYTIRLGVNESYMRHSYYSGIMSLDAERVRRRFAEAETKGIKVLEHALTDQELWDHVSTRGPAIVLVDSTLLSCDLCKHNKLKAEFRRVFGGAYRGHYVALVGRSARGLWLFRDPALRARLCAAPARRLRAARRASGTDRDVILVYNDYT